MDEDESHLRQVMLAVCLVDLSPALCDTIRNFYRALPSQLRPAFLHLLARARAESAQLADMMGGKLMEGRQN
ncbi:MAG TPA: hypothetical protein VK066_17860 [Chloroflexota bacterium]|nr:hypothetical protein [Chloroflexota bacterium]